MLKIAESPVSGWVFLILFPGFFFYNYLVANGFIAPMLGGYFGLTALASLPFVGLIFIRDIIRRNVGLNKLDLSLLILMLYVACAAIFHYIVSSGTDVDRELFKNVMAAVLFNMILYMIGRTINFNNKSLKNATLASLIIMTILIMFNIGDRGMYQIEIDSQIADNISTYQGLGRSIMVVAIFLLATRKSKFGFLMVGFASLIALLLNGARSELVGVIAALLAIMVAKYGMRRLIWIGIILFAGAVSILLHLPLSIVEHSRVFELIRLGESSSALARSELMNDALRTIYENPVFGDYGSYVRESGMGGYSHNLLSAWVDFGVFGFLFYCLCLIMMGLALLRYFRRPSSRNDVFTLALGFFVCTALLMVFAKEYRYMLFGLSMGLVARVIDVLRCSSAAVNNHYH